MYIPDGTVVQTIAAKTSGSILFCLLRLARVRGEQSCLWMECYSTPVDTPVLDSSGVDSSRGWSGVE
jgi:hypothetical protein